MISQSRYLMLVGLLVLIPVSAWAIIYRPMNKALNCVAEEIRTRTTSYSHFDEINSHYRQLKYLTRTLKDSTAEAYSRIPQEHGADQWLESASDAALELDMVVKSVTTSGERVEGEFGVLPVDISVQGTLDGVYRLLQHFERMDYISRIDRMGIHLVEDDVVEARIVVHLIFSIGGNS
ncbi:MAG: type 4a pilus biogenesis protein PilO [Planctomycetes bacterium]|nr:type 4a pilus biogenesis protein PilO [Planctomycetota bacterium]